MLVIPPFNQDGNLPAGLHPCSWPEFVNVFSWSQQRKWLIAGLERALHSLKDAGCVRVFVDGSFVTRKDDPGDYDGCWEAAGVDPLKLDPVLLTFDPGRVAQRTKYRGEFFPAHGLADGKTGKRYMEFFQQDKDGKAKGLVALDLGSLP